MIICQKALCALYCLYSKIECPATNYNSDYNTTFLRNDALQRQYVATKYRADGRRARLRSRGLSFRTNPPALEDFIAIPLLAVAVVAVVAVEVAAVEGTLTAMLLSAIL
jgi:hypothetical protein